MTDEVPAFRVREWVRFTSSRPNCKIAYVELDREVWDEEFPHLTGQTVRLYPGPDGVNVAQTTCLGVEKFLHGPPWKVGESIGLLIDLMTIGTLVE